MKTRYFDLGNFFNLAWVLLVGLLSTGPINPAYHISAFPKIDNGKHVVIKQHAEVITIRSGCGIDTRLYPPNFAVVDDDGLMKKLLAEIGSRLSVSVHHIKIFKSKVMTSLAVSGITNDNRNVIIVHESLYTKPRNIQNSVLLHELGHFQHRHFLTWRCGYPRTRELEADEFMGAHIGKFTNQKHEALSFLELINFGDNTYPSKQERIARIELAFSGGHSLNLDPNVSAFKYNLTYTLNCENDNSATVEINFKEKIAPFKSTFSAYKYLQGNVAKINIYGSIRRGNGRGKIFSVEACAVKPSFNLDRRSIYIGNFRLQPNADIPMEDKNQNFKIDVVFRNGQEIRIDD